MKKVICYRVGRDDVCKTCEHGKPHCPVKYDAMSSDDLCTTWSECSVPTCKDIKVRCVKVKT